ncbi:MAG: TIGR01777 family oxidoreductase [Bacteroidota bacterium]
MKILIAGATGLIGKELVRQCHEAKMVVHYLTTRKEKIEQRPNYKGFYWNPSAGEIDQEAFEGVSVIINLAGASVSERWTRSYKIKILESRIMTAAVLFDSLKNIKHQVTHYISASGISIYPSSKQKHYSEDSTTVSDSFLGKVTVEWEAAADRFSELNIAVAKVRIGIVLAKNGGALPQIVKPIAMRVGSALGDGQQWQSWIHIEDIAGIFLFILNHKLSGVFNGVAPSPVTNEKMTKAIATHLKKRLWMPKVPAFALKLLLGEMGSLALESQLVGAQKIEAEGYLFHYVNFEKAIDDLL